MNLTAFILDEGLKNKQVVTLHRFNELYREQVLIDLKERLAKAWKGECSTKNSRLTKAEAEEARLKNPDVMTQAQLSVSPIKAHVSGTLVSPSVAIPLALPEERRKLLEKELLKVAELCLTQLLADWEEAFKFERKSGTMGTYFKVKRNDHSVRLVIDANDNGVTHEATVCYVIIERGRPNTKTKAFDLACLRVS